MTERADRSESGITRSLIDNRVVPRSRIVDDEDAQSKATTVGDGDGDLTDGSTFG
jgi:hypothetical protein